MEPADVERALRSHLDAEFSAIVRQMALAVAASSDGGSGGNETVDPPPDDPPLKLKLSIVHAAKAFSGDPDSANYRAAREAVLKVHGTEPDMTRSGGSIPVTLPFQDMGKSVLLLPVGRGDDGAHSHNEKLNVSNFMNGIKVMAAYLMECGQTLRK